MHYSTLTLLAPIATAVDKALEDWSKQAQVDVDMESIRVEELQKLKGEVDVVEDCYNDQLKKLTK